MFCLPTPSVLVTSFLVCISQAISKMKDLQQVCVSDTLLSGRMFLRHPNLKLTRLEASGCPFSIHSLKQFGNTNWEFRSNLSFLDLAGCEYINKNWSKAPPL